MDNTEHASTSSVRDRLLSALETAESDDAHCVRAQTLRLIKCAMRDRDVTARSNGNCSGCEETDITKLLHTMVAQREISAREYDEAGRINDAEREREEMEVIQSFLPAPLEGKALEQAVEAVVDDLEATKLKDVGRCMAALQERFPGRIDTGKAGKAVRQALG